MKTLTIYMKSGNRIKLRHITNWKIESKGNLVCSLFITRQEHSWLSALLGRTERLILTSIDLSQIEAITES